MTSKLIKLVVRHLPPDLTEEQLRDQLSPMPESMRSLVFHACVGAELFAPEYRFNRAYVEFAEQSEATIFAARWHRYVFVDGRGVEYRARVETAMQQRSSARRRRRRPDPKCGTIASDSTYQRFIEDEEKAATATTVAATVSADAEQESARKPALPSGGDGEDTPLVRYAKLTGEARREHAALRDQTYADRFRRRRGGGVGVGGGGGGGMAASKRRAEKRRETAGQKACRVAYSSATPTDAAKKKRDVRPTRYLDKKRESGGSAQAGPTQKPDEIGSAKKQDRTNRYRDRPTMALYDPSKRSRQVDHRKDN